jgi:hypothetical protein
MRIKSHCTLLTTRFIFMYTSVFNYRSGRPGSPWLSNLSCKNVKACWNIPLKILWLCRRGEDKRYSGRMRETTARAKCGEDRGSLSACLRHVFYHYVSPCSKRLWIWFLSKRNAPTLRTRHMFLATRTVASHRFSFTKNIGFDNIKLNCDVVYRYTAKCVVSDGHRSTDLDLTLPFIAATFFSIRNYYQIC